MHRSDILQIPRKYKGFELVALVKEADGYFYRLHYLRDDGDSFEFKIAREAIASASGRAMLSELVEYFDNAIRYEADA